MDFSQMKTKEIEALLHQTADNDLPDILNLLHQDSRKAVQNLAMKYLRQLEKQEKERQRIAAMWEHEKKAKVNGYQWVAGTDEVGRGPLAGPVVAAAVILPEHADLPGINDSKKLSEKQREQLDILIKEQAIAWSIASLNETEIDQLNILEASRQAMQNAVSELSQPADFVLVDGLPNPRITLPSEAIVKGDSHSISIAAASVIAKVYRDRLMDEYDKLYPGYGFAANKGYPTEEHIKGVMEQGPCPIHRMTFRPLSEMKESRPAETREEQLRKMEERRKLDEIIRVKYSSEKKTEIF